MPSLPSSKRLRHPAPKDNLLQKLFLRESFGQVRSRRRPTRHEALSKLFTRLPARLAFCLKDVVPYSAIEAGHIFLGFTKCGQFLLSYTQTTVDVDLARDINIRFNYYLHFWLFVPSRRTKKVGEVLLFSDDGATGNLHISFSQWPHDEGKLVVYGSFIGDFDTGSFSKPCYLTVTALPSLKGCKECVRVAASFEEDDVAESWNSCIRLSCLEHAMTIHTAFDLAAPFPTFIPKVNLKRNGQVIVNTGNLLHCLRINLEDLSKVPDEEPTLKPVTSMLSSPSCRNRWSELQVGTSELTLSALGTEVFSPPMCSPGSVAHYSTASDSETTDCESDYGIGKRFGGNVIQNEERIAKVEEFVQALNDSPPKRNLVLKRARGNSPSAVIHETLEDDESGPSTSRKRMAAEKAYELTDDDFDDGVKEKLSTFRKKRLAEKTYEFRDEDSENVTPLPRLRPSVQSSDNRLTVNTVNEEAENALAVAKSPRSENGEHVLKPIDPSNVMPLASTASTSAADDEVMCVTEDSEVSEIMVDTMPVPELLSPGGMLKKDHQQSMISPRAKHPPTFHAKVTRRFIESDDEMTSVITDIEDEDGGVGGITTSLGFHIVLPLQVHGSGYQPMSMISNAKAGKLTGRCVKVQQNSFELELFCHDMAQKLCQAAGKKYWFCNDYDVEIIDVDPDTGDILFVAVVLVKAATFMKKVSQLQKYSITSLHRHQYQASFKFVWNPDTSESHVLDSEPLKEISPFQEPRTDWHPATSMSHALQKAWGVTSNSGVKTFNNDPVIKGTSLKTIVESEHLMAIIHDDLDWVAV